MNKLMLSAMCVFALVFSARVALAEACEACDAAKGESVVKASTDGKTTTLSGVLICNACGEKMMKKENPQEAAAGHPKSCSTSEGCSKGGFALVSGKKLYKLDEKSSARAKEYLLEKDTTSKVKVEGKVNDDGVLEIASISPQKDEKEQSKQ